jgi:hypothetical protein
MRPSALLHAAMVPYVLAIDCATPGYAIFADMHDGDMKKGVLGADGFFSLTPYNNTQSWTVKSKWNAKFCNASIGKSRAPNLHTLSCPWTSATC